MRLSHAGQRFYQEVQKAEGRISLAAAALYIAQESYWDIDPKVYLATLDAMAADVRSRLPKNRYPLRVIQVINDYLYGELKFSGNKHNYYDPDNSYLNCVIDRRLGIPISLSLLYLEIARRVRFPMVGVGMPGHFLVRPVIDEMAVLVDPFNRGEILFVEDCKEKFYALHTPEVCWRPEFLNGILPKTFLARILMNLKMVYLRQEDFESTVMALDKLLILAPRQYQQMRDRGILHYELQNYDLARQDLRQYLRSHPNPPDSPSIQQLLDKIDSSRP